MEETPWVEPCPGMNEHPIRDAETLYRNEDLDEIYNMESIKTFLKPPSTQYLFMKDIHRKSMTFIKHHFFRCLMFLIVVMVVDCS